MILIDTANEHFESYPVNETNLISRKSVDYDQKWVEMSIKLLFMRDGMHSIIH